MYMYSCSKCTYSDEFSEKNVILEEGEFSDFYFFSSHAYLTPLKLICQIQHKKVNHGDSLRQGEMDGLEVLGVDVSITSQR